MIKFNEKSNYEMFIIDNSHKKMTKPQFVLGLIKNKNDEATECSWLCQNKNDKAATQA